MDEKRKKFNAEEEAIKAEDNLKEEISANSLAEEILPLMKDFFEGEFTGNNNSLLCVFQNDQRFKITIEKT